jgi:hypothetical protein
VHSAVNKSVGKPVDTSRFVADPGHSCARVEQALFRDSQLTVQSSVAALGGRTAATGPASCCLSV